jgi:hypothetical protein
MVHHDTDKYNLKLRSGNKTAMIRTTRDHLFWDLTRHRWITAGALRYGDHLRSSDGASVTVTGGYAPRDRDGWMWDLTIPGGNDHDFYVDTAVAAVLVHNCPNYRRPAGPLWKRCAVAIGAAWAMFHSVHTGQIPTGPRIPYEIELHWEDQTPRAEGPPVPGDGEGGGGDPEGGGEC